MQPQTSTGGNSQDRRVWKMQERSHVKQCRTTHNYSFWELFWSVMDSPNFSWVSKTRTSQPCFSMEKAQVKPPTPPPATITFKGFPSLGLSPACVPASDTTVTWRFTLHRLHLFRSRRRPAAAATTAPATAPVAAVAKLPFGADGRAVDGAIANGAAGDTTGAPGEATKAFKKDMAARFRAGTGYNARATNSKRVGHHDITQQPNKLKTNFHLSEFRNSVCSLANPQCCMSQGTIASIHLAWMDLSMDVSINSKCNPKNIPNRMAGN